MSFVILAEPRSGSTHLARFLKDTNKINWNNGNVEILNPRNRIDNKSEKLLDFYQNPPSGTKILLTPDQIDGDVIKTITDLNLKIILLTREDKANQIISHAYAYISRIWHNYDLKYKCHKVNINLGAVRWIFMHYKRVKKWVNVVKNMNNVLKVEYNDVITVEGKKKVCEFIGIKWDDNFKSIILEQKMSDLSYKELIINYEEVYNKVSEFVDKYY